MERKFEHQLQSGNLPQPCKPGFLKNKLKLVEIRSQ